MNGNPRMLKLRISRLARGSSSARSRSSLKACCRCCNRSRGTKVTASCAPTWASSSGWCREASDYTPLEQRGRRVYTAEGCWYCHSQYVRPVTGETRRWGPVTQAGEYAFDLPHLFSTRRIGPDLTRVGMKYSDEWHLAHFWDPRMVVPDSIMPSFGYLFDGPYGR